MMSFHSKAYLASLSAEERERLFRTHLSLGWHPDTRDELLLSETARRSSMYLLGKPGYGKTGFLRTFVRQDICANNAIFALDPNLDFTNDVQAEMPAHRVKDTYVFDMQDTAFPFGLNVLSQDNVKNEEQREQAVERILHIFEVFWPEIASQQNLPRYLSMATLALINTSGSTLLDMYDFLLKAEVRARILSRVTDPTVLAFWDTQYNRLKTDDARIQKVAPLLGRLESLFAGRSIMRNILGQRRSTIDFRRAIEERQIILMKLPVNSMGQNAYLIGTIIIAQLTAALFSFVDTPVDQRPGVSLYVDEFQNFTTKDFAKLLTEGRKYGLRIVMAHQFRDQIHDADVRKAAVTARTIICLHTTPEDATEMAKEFPAQGGEFVLSRQATKELLKPQGDLPSAVKEFAETYLRTVPKSGGEVRIKKHEFSRYSQHPSGGAPIIMPNPIGELDALFHRVMESGNPNLPIPDTAVLGLADGGGGFVTALVPRLAWLLTCSIRELPAYLVRPVADGSFVWLRPPEDAKEQFIHCIFHLRMTMHYLAKHPVGKQDAAKNENVASMLTQLPKRAAFVKSDKDSGVIFSHDLPEPLRGPMLEERLRTIQAQTRAKYCHPRAEIEESQAHEPAKATNDAVSLPSEPAVADGTFHLRGHADLDETINVRAVRPQPTPAQPQTSQQPHLRRQWQEVDS